MRLAVFLFTLLIAFQTSTAASDSEANTEPSQDPEPSASETSSEDPNETGAATAGTEIEPAPKLPKVIKITEKINLPITEDITDTSVSKPEENNPEGEKKTSSADVAEDKLKAKSSDTEKTEEKEPASEPGSKLAENANKVGDTVKNLGAKVATESSNIVNDAIEEFKPVLHFKDTSSKGTAPAGTEVKERQHDKTAEPAEDKAAEKAGQKAEKEDKTTSSESTKQSEPKHHHHMTSESRIFAALIPKSGNGTPHVVHHHSKVVTTGNFHPKFMKGEPIDISKMFNGLISGRHSAMSPVAEIHNHMSKIANKKGVQENLFKMLDKMFGKGSSFAELAGGLGKGFHSLQNGLISHEFGNWKQELLEAERKRNESYTTVIRALEELATGSNQTQQDYLAIMKYQKNIYFFTFATMVMTVLILLGGLACMSTLGNGRAKVVDAGYNKQAPPPSGP